MAVDLERHTRVWIFFRWLRRPICRHALAWESRTATDRHCMLQGGPSTPHTQGTLVAARRCLACVPAWARVLWVPAGWVAPATLHAPDERAVCERLGRSCPRNDDTHSPFQVPFLLPSMPNTCFGVVSIATCLPHFFAQPQPESYCALVAQGIRVGLLFVGRRYRVYQCQPSGVQGIVFGVIPCVPRRSTRSAQTRCCQLGLRTCRRRGFRPWTVSALHHLGAPCSPAGPNEERGSPRQEPPPLQKTVRLLHKEAAALHVERLKRYDE
jgi:hypothetical protein